MDFKTYIKNVVNESEKEQYIINEAKTKGLFDSLFNSTDKNARKFLTSFSNFFSLFTGEATKTELALQKVCQDRKKDAQKRLDKIKKAKDKAKAAQIKAKYALEKNQADIRATRKIEAFNALEKKYKRMQTFYKGNIFEYGPEEIAMIDKQFEDSFKALTSGGDLEAAEKIKAYKDVLMIKEDGTIRTKAELEAFVKSDDGKNILGKLQGFKGVDEKLANYTAEHADEIWNELSQMEEYTPPMDIKEAEKQLENVDKQISTIEKQIKNVGKLDDFDKNIIKYQEDIDAAEKKSKEISVSEDTTNPVYSLSDSFFKEHPVTDCIKNDGQSSSIENDKLKNMAMAMGLSEDDAASFVDKINEKFDEARPVNIDDLKTEINNLVSDDNSIQNALKDKKNKDNEDLEKAKKIKADEEKARTEFMNAMGDEYDPNLNKNDLETMKNNAKELRSDLEKQRGNIESIKKGNEERVKHAKGLVGRLEEEDSYDEDMKTALKKERDTPTLKPGEVWDPEKQEAGYFDEDNKWKSRPKDLDGQTDYMEKLNKQNIFKPLPKEKELTYTYDKENKQFKDSDGNVVEGEDNIKKAKETYIKEKVYNEKILQSNGPLEQRKADLLDKYIKLVDKDGKVDKGKYDQLSKDEKDEFEMVVSRYGEIVDLGDGKKLEGGNYGRLGKVKKMEEREYQEKKEKEKEKKDGKKDDENIPKDLTPDDFEEGEEFNKGDDIKYYKKDGEFYKKEGDNEPVKIEDFDDWLELVEDTDDFLEEFSEDELAGMEDEGDEKIDVEVDGKTVTIPKKDPEKIWHPRPLKNGEGLSKTRYNRKGTSLGYKQFLQQKKAYEIAKQQGKIDENNSFSGYIKGQLINETKSNYGKFRQYLNEILK